MSVTTNNNVSLCLESGAPVESRPLTTIREQLSALYGERGGEFTLPMGKKLKEGLKALNSMTVSQRRNIKRQAMLTKVSGRNDSVFFATVGAFVLVPPLAILAIAVLTGYVQLLPWTKRCRFLVAIFRLIIHMKVLLLCKRIVFVYIVRTCIWSRDWSIKRLVWREYAVSIRHEEHQ